MNGVLNTIFIIFLFIVLIAFDYMYSMSDIITDQLNSSIAASFNINTTNSTIAQGGLNTISQDASSMYGEMRDLLYSVVTGIMVPFLLFLTFFSSFVNRNQNAIMYLCQVIAILMILPLCVYVFSDLFTNLTSISILDSAYMASIYFQNFMGILLVNGLLAVASFIFVQRANTVSA